MFENLCTLPLSSELFAQAIHPTEPIVAVGLSSGHVESYRLPAGPTEDDDGASTLSTGTSTIDTEWKTRRHKGSCRSLCYSGDGSVLYSAGTDGILKIADSITGKVTSKYSIPLSPSSELDPPTLLHALSPQTLLLATDSAALHLYDLRDPSTFLQSKPSQTHRPHEDYISSITPLAPTSTSTSGFSKQWVTTGGTTLAVTDLRRGVLVKSEYQEEELLSSVFVGGLPSKPGRSKGEKVLVGNSSGVLTLWERGVWDDQDERIIVDGRGKSGGDSLDAICVMPEGIGGGGKNVIVGVGDGTVRIFKLGPNKMVGEPLRHDEIESVVAVGFDVGGRMITGGGSTVKVWQEQEWQDEDEDDDDSDDGVPDSDDSDNEEEKKKNPAASSKHSMNASSDDDSSSEEEKKPRKKKGKQNKGPHGESGVLAFQID